MKFADSRNWSDKWEDEPVISDPTGEKIPTGLKDDIIQYRGKKCEFCKHSDMMHREMRNQSLHVHHIIPKEYGGQVHPDNFLVLCSQCHALLERITRHLIEKFES